MGGGEGDACGIKIRVASLEIISVQGRAEVKYSRGGGGGQTVCKVSSPEIVCFQGNDEV